MKKACSLLLTFLLLFSVMLPAFGEEELPGATNESEPQRIEMKSAGDVPVIVLSGDGNDIFDADGNKAYSFPYALAAMITGEEGVIPDDFDLKESFLTVLKAYIKGAITADEDKFYDALQAEVAKLTDRIQMDENGEPRYGTDIAASFYEINRRSTSVPNPDGPYETGDYHFWYDWRRSPLEIADQLDAYIEGICAMTGKEQIGVVGRCLGSNFVLAYLTKYGYKNRICGLGLDCGMMHGQDAISESFSGKFASDGDAIQRYLSDMDVTLDGWIVDLINFMEASGMFDNMNASVKAPIYARVAKGVTSALSLSTLATIPGYWSCVSNRDYNNALLYVFGKPGSEKRQKYAGLIEKIEAYHNQVQLGMDDLIRRFAADGGKIAVVSKYGFQLMPMCVSRNAVADSYVSVGNSSMGATTSAIYNTLEDDYIRGRIASGLDKYISPDKQIDASTCMFPDCTWFFRGIEHNRWTPFEDRLFYTVLTADRQYTVDDFPYSQFIVRDEEGIYHPMSAENHHTEHWEATDPATLTFFDRVARFFETLRKLIGDLFLWIGGKMKS